MTPTNPIMTHARMKATRLSLTGVLAIALTSSAAACSRQETQTPSTDAPTRMAGREYVVRDTIVQATFIAGSAILLEAALSFLGVGIPRETPTWGNIMAEGRSVFQILPHNILYPAAFLTVAVLAVNMLGDGLRDTLDPRMAKRV